MKNLTPHSNHRVHPASVRAIADKFYREPVQTNIYIHCLNLCNDYMTANKLTWRNIDIGHVEEVITFARSKADTSDLEHQDFTSLLTRLLKIIAAPPVERFGPHSREHDDQCASIIHFLFSHTDTLAYLSYMLEPGALLRYTDGIDGKILERVQK
jgi:hypothetical protein